MSYSVFSSITSITSEQITDALRALGKGDGTDADATRARLFLETVPLTALVETLPVLWTGEDKKWRRRSVLWRILAGAVVALFITSIVLLLMGRNEPNGQHGYRFWS